MQDHGLEYPDFFKKLYAMVTPMIFETEHRAKFLKLLALFLSSSYVQMLQSDWSRHVLIGMYPNTSLLRL